MTLPDTAERGPLHTDRAPEPVPTATLPAAADIAALLELSYERDLWMRRLDVAWREGWRIGFAAGHAAGRADEGAERDEAWHRNAFEMAAGLDPDGPQARELTGVRIRAAESGGRRDAAEHWDEFMQRARETPASLRSEAQLAAVIPIRRKWGTRG